MKMAELWLSRSCMSQIYRVVCTDFVLLFSFVFRHPLYLSYLVFFSPYLFKLASFLSPLFVTISLVLLALIYDNFTPKLSEPGCSFLLSAFSAVFDILSSKSAEEFEDLEELEVYKIVFLLDETTLGLDLAESSEAEVSEPECEEKYCLEDVDQVLAETTEFPLIEEKKEMLHSTLEKEVDCRAAIFNKVLQVEEEASKLRIGSEAVDINIDCCDYSKKYTGIVKLRIESYDKIDKGNITSEGRYESYDNAINKGEGRHESYDKIVKGNVTDEEGHTTNFDNEGSKLGTYGSMRKEKEWKRTLACKLFEERHYSVAEGGEGMDSLWEAYECDSTNSTRKNTKNKNAKKKSSDLDYIGNADEDEDEDEVEMTNGRLCCLQAFKFSARKMNMGMGRTNIVKITKALKGIGWLHHAKRHHAKDKP